ncbi:MAG: type II CAAX prenyl endopeptidase Rce1 family protein [Anaerolineales bacterium]
MLGVYAVSLFGNIIGEELWWRGYILPIQERAFGKWAWLINGLLWIVVFHAFLMRFCGGRTRLCWPRVCLHHSLPKSFKAHGRL